LTLLFLPELSVLGGGFICHASHPVARHPSRQGGRQGAKPLGCAADDHRKIVSVFAASALVGMGFGIAERYRFNSWKSPKYMG
jgi:hypothetical protein